MKTFLFLVNFPQTFEVREIKIAAQNILTFDFYTFFLVFVSNNYDSLNKFGKNALILVVTSKDLNGYILEYAFLLFIFFNLDFRA